MGSNTNNIPHNLDSLIELAARIVTCVDRYALLTLFIAACSILYELILAQTLAMLAANTVVWYSVIVGCFLLGMGLGAAFDSKFLNNRDTWTKLIWVELCLSILGLVCVPVMHCTHAFFLQQYAIDGGFGIALYGFFATGICLGLLIGFFSGFELPILMTLASKKHDESNVSIILGWDYIGSLIGAILFPLLLLPNFELPLIASYIASINLAIALWLILTTKSSKKIARGGQIVVCALLSLGLIQAWSNQRSFKQLLLQQYYYFIEKSDSSRNIFSLSNEFPDVERYSSPYQKIDIFHDVALDTDDILIQAYSDKLQKEPDYPRDKLLFLNQDFQINTNFDEVYHEYFAHVPVLMRGSVPKRVLVLGAGDGLLLHELLKYAGMQISHVDLDRELVKQARVHPILRKANRDAMRDRRVHRQFADGYQFMRQTKKKFDAVYIDFPAAADYNLAKLYSREFFAFVRKRLAPGGFAVFDATGIGLLTTPETGKAQSLDSENSWPLYYHTLKAAGFKQIKPYLTTLELDNSRILEVIANSDMRVPLDPEVAAVIQTLDDPAAKEQVLNTYIEEFGRELTAQFVLGLQQGFIALANESGTLRNEFSPLTVPTYILNQKRFELAFSVTFPEEDKIDWNKVNSIVRPTFPDSSVWFPRVPF